MYTIESIAKIVGGKVIRQFYNNQITRLSIDSRKLQEPESVLFFALQGPRNDGHQFIRELYERGVRNFVVSKTTENIDLLFEANIIKVDRSRTALQRLAAHHRSQFDIPTVGITGSNGKTIVKEWLYQVLQTKFNIVRSPKSYNSQVGVPLSVWNIDPIHTLGLFEAGISKPGEMENLQKVIQPKLGVFINLREAHDVYFDNREEKAFEKLKLFKGCEALIYNGDYPEIEGAMERAGWLRNTNLIRCSFQDQSADFFVSEIDRFEDNATLNVLHGKEKIALNIPFSDNGSIENALLCYATALELGHSSNFVVDAMQSLQRVAMRLQMIEGINGCGVINDAYNSDMGSLEIALDFANQQHFLKKKTLILSDILQSGVSPNKLYSAVARLCKDKKMDRLIGIGPEISGQEEKFDFPVQLFSSTDEFLAQFRMDEFDRELIVIKGARPFRFERISRLLEHKTHETVLEINMDALVHNLNYFKSKIGPHTDIMVMVKAFSYGMGSHEVAHILEYNNVAYLSVAYTDEGIELRKAGVQLPIMVMNPDEPSYDALIRHRLEPEIFSLRTLRAFIGACKSYAAGQKQAIHLKLDTGMHRLGFESKEIPVLTGLLNENPSVKVASVFSHLAAADDPGHDNFTKSQIAQFKQMAETLRKSLGYSFRRHILNTVGILRFPESQYEMVRLGIGLYGYSANSEAMSNQIPSSRLKTIISQIKHLNAGETVGYQRSGEINAISRIATLPIGYADGFNRSLGNGRGEVSIQGRRAKTVGNICMDMCMVDVSDIPCKEGDEVEVFGNDISMNELAEKMGTIPYEVITSISRRVKRVYYHD